MGNNTELTWYGTSPFSTPVRGCPPLDHRVRLRRTGAMDKAWTTPSAPCHAPTPVRINHRVRLGRHVDSARPSSDIVGRAGAAQYHRDRKEHRPIQRSGHGPAHDSEHRPIQRESGRTGRVRNIALFEDAGRPWARRDRGAARRVARPGPHEKGDVRIGGKRRFWRSSDRNTVDMYSSPA